MSLCTLQCAVVYVNGTAGQCSNATSKEHKVAVVTDGPSFIVKIGKDWNYEHRLCNAHGLHLAVCDDAYMKTELNSDEFNLINDPCNNDEKVEDTFQDDDQKIIDM
ncbi:Hypothetical predicted protein [Octopus vulgaris]|uniref:Uncharacterized protein n=1 Tax=Octopus vulgaris TaxID=6645 RepID=A0AA36B6P3_OCTVU|nr:Hypothetical predicted protein [Octopus vulgaris]